MPPSVEPLTNRVILTFPSLLQLSAADAARSWTQLVRTGSFVSSRYGKFDITPDDLRMMAANFRPDVTPIDYDHLTQNPQHPAAGIAAGWLRRVELRDGGNTLWGLVEWTPDAEKRIENREYKFISPSFVKDYKTPTGEKVGTKLLAAALTNMPFLPEMAAVTLGADAIFGQFALSLPPDNTGPISMTELDQVVSFKLDAEVTPELTPEERAQSFRVKATIGQGDDQFVRLTTIDNKEFGWFRVNQLRPADAPEKKEENSMSTKTAVKMSATDELISLANAIAVEHPEMSLADAYMEAGRRRVDLAEARRTEIGVVESTDDESNSAVPVSLSVRDGETFDALCLRYADEKQISLRQAIPIVSAAHPKLAESYGRGNAVA